MYSLFNVRINWGLFIGLALLIYVLFPDISMYSYLAILISMHQFFLLFNSIGYVIPVRYLFGAFMCLQMLLGPMLAYNGLDRFQAGTYRMQIPEAQYFNYVLPAVCYFIIGLHAFAGKLKGEILDLKRIENFVNQDKNIAYILIGVGFISSIISEYFSTNLAFVFYLLAGFKFIGAFMLILGNRKLKIIPLLLVFGSIISSSLGAGMFQDLLTWLIFLGMVFAVKYKPTAKIKRVFTALFIFLSLAIQQLKGGYREATWQKGEEAGLGTLSKAYEESQQQNSFFSYQSLAASNVRFNQGYIVTNIMANVPKKVAFAEGAELYQILEAAFLPRFLAPDKLTAGNRDIFMKYSGMKIARSTSMGLSSIGDAYVNFGVTGGWFFMLFLGLFFNLVLQMFYKYSKNFPVLLLFAPLLFYYPIRPDCELQTILGHLVKSSFLVFFVFTFWKRYFINHTRASEEDTHLNTLVSSGV